MSASEVFTRGTSWFFFLILDVTQPESNDLISLLFSVKWYIDICEESDLAINPLSLSKLFGIFVRVSEAVNCEFAG